MQDQVDTQSTYEFGERPLNRAGKLQWDRSIFRVGQLPGLKLTRLEERQPSETAGPHRGNASAPPRISPVPPGRRSALFVENCRHLRCVAGTSSRAHATPLVYGAIQSGII